MDADIEVRARIVLQNMTCALAPVLESAPILIRSLTGNGVQGFQTPIEPDSFIVDGIGALGTSHVERGLAYIEVALSGHM